jgi:hypothetical protein
MRCGAISVMRSGDMALAIYRWQAGGRKIWGKGLKVGESRGKCEFGGLLKKCKVERSSKKQSEVRSENHQWRDWLEPSKGQFQRSIGAFGALGNREISGDDGRRGASIGNSP